MFFCWLIAVFLLAALFAVIFEVTSAPTVAASADYRLLGF